MAQDAARIPAWRRLGLALKNQEAAGVAVPENQTLSIAPPPSVSNTEPEVNGHSSKLGKRKHQHEPVQHEHQETKKSRITTSDTQATENTENAHHEVPEVAPEKESAPAKPVKGDSNYRKKKEKPAKRPKAISDAHSAGSQPHTQPSRASPRPALLASTETNGANEASFATPLKKPSRKDPSASPSLGDRRKSVAFTPDTKKADGNTGQDYFKAWVASQKGTGQVSQPPEVSNFVLHALIADEEKTARKNGQLEKSQGSEEATSLNTKKTKSEENLSAQPAKTEEATSRQESKPAASNSTPQIAPAAKGRKKDPSIYIAYLNQYYNDRDNWKFNKAKQNDVVDNALNVFRIPTEHTEALTTYVAGLQGAGVIERLRERCHATLKDLDEQDAKMDDVEARKVAQEEAEQERIAKERARRKTESDVAALAKHPYSPGFVRRLQRRRADALLAALSRTAPVTPVVTPRSNLDLPMRNVEPLKSNARKRKRRTEVSSDESSSDSSSDESSDSDSDPDSDSNSDTDSDSDSDSSSDSGSGSGSDSNSNSDSDSDSNLDSNSKSKSSKTATSSDGESGSDSDSSSSDSSSDSDSD